MRVRMCVSVSMSPHPVAPVHHGMHSVATPPDGRIASSQTFTPATIDTLGVGISFSTISKGAPAVTATAARYFPPVMIDLDEPPHNGTAAVCLSPQIRTGRPRVVQVCRLYTTEFRRGWRLMRNQTTEGCAGWGQRLYVPKHTGSLIAAQYVAELLCTNSDRPRPRLVGHTPCTEFSASWSD